MNLSNRRRAIMTIARLRNMTKTAVNEAISRFMKNGWSLEDAIELTRKYGECKRGVIHRLGGEPTKRRGSSIKKERKASL